MANYERFYAQLIPTVLFFLLSNDTFYLYSHISILVYVTHVFATA